MNQPKPSDALSRSQRRHRARRRDGLKVPRVWVPNPSRPGFKEEAPRQASLLKGASEEVEALRFIAAAFDWRD
ncbi:antitoxin MazE family protein [Methylobacterium sp. J-048]|uniref:antitoxin MazE-like protein n=1 Tax=Methylobacterium sp. J-048 TaxID=2836635 RepID=UPI001FBAAB87|nr:antitoxin MazE-like protein [Methylobacterium sp. J-048]MCJ2058767.1 antitoxin MazE family protein [Methylobacterium sp. J-048]